MNITVFNQLVLSNYGFYDQKQTFENYNYNHSLQQLRILQSSNTSKQQQGAFNC